MGFDDVLCQLRDALASSDAAAVVAALQARYKVVLIDEFQDTDRVQWEIFSTLFGHPGSGRTLVLVGDPKQAIYRFRGADIAVYLQAVHGDGVRERSTLPTNWRVGRSGLDALHALLDGSSFGDPAVALRTGARRPMPIVTVACGTHDERTAVRAGRPPGVGPGLP